VKARRDGHVVSVAVIVAVGVNGDGRREVLGLAIGTSEAETFWTDFLRKLARRGLRGVKLVVSDAHEGLKPPEPSGARALHVETGRIRSVIGLTLGGGHPPASGGRDRKSLGGKHRGAAWSVRLRLLS